MEYVRKVDFAALEASAERLSQPLLQREFGTAEYSLHCIKTPAGGGSPAGMHTHPGDQIFYILSGTMSLEIAGQAYEAGPGTMVFFPAGVEHRNWNGGAEPTVHLVVNMPPAGAGNS
jgi:quercetin dioxygenase-like cupin family protein